MSSFHYLFLFGNILFYFIPLTNTISLDINCTNNTVCGGPGTSCSNSICQCVTPWYTPCQTTACNPKPTFIYEGEACRTDANCLDNTMCNSTTKLCQCKPSFTAINGLCYKSLNVSCTSKSECWSNFCDSVCKCDSGFIPRDASRCQRNLAKIYANWIDANTSSDFCYGTDSSSCLVPFAICQNDGEHSGNFCQCLPGYNANYDLQQCQLITYTGLSPSSTPLLNEGCGKCQATNAICVQVVNQTTCWCQAGFSNNNGQCGENRKSFIFPNDYDIIQHQYASPSCSINADNGTIEANNGLCTCAPGFTFVNKTSPCQPIQPQWQGDAFEYGVCTSIDSNGESVKQSGWCPHPLTCQDRQDKHVCSCGRDQYCYLELILNSKDVPCNTSDSTGDEKCEALYGGYARFCNQGQCQCMSNSSYYDNNTCVTLLDIESRNKSKCPANAENNNGSCACKAGYQANSTNRTCQPKVNQITNNSSGSSNFNITEDDCRALFPNQPVNASSSSDACVCAEGAFLQNNRCVFELGYPFPTNSYTMYCPENASPNNMGQCECNPGYMTQNNMTCENITNTVYPYNSTTGENITKLNNNADCQALFGSAAELSPYGRYCACGNESVAFLENNRCYFLIGVTQSISIQSSDCPPYSEVGENNCTCLVGYRPVSTNQKCEPIQSVNSSIQSIDPAIGTQCNTMYYTDQGCEALYGVGAVCRNNTCYCNQFRSFVQNGRCVLYSTYVFPGIHERYLYTCNSQQDCGTNADQNGIECDYLNSVERNYKVCKCQKGYFLSPSDSTCVKYQCSPQCSENETCQYYQCICNVGFYRNPSGRCVNFGIKPNLHDSCNISFWNELRFANEPQPSCSQDCGRIVCLDNYHDDGSQCVQNTLDDHCAHNQTSFCSQFGNKFQCNRDDNKCICSDGYYQEENTCVLPVNATCKMDEECGANKKCTGQICACDTGKIPQNTNDAFGRTMQRCSDPRNGVDHIRFNPVLFLFIVLAYVFFA